MASLLAEVVKDMKLRSASARKIHLFPSNSPCPLSLGLAESLFSDAWIGYPFFMDWASPEDVKLEGAVLKTYWNPLSAKGFDFKSGESFLFSEAACKFSLGKAYLDASPDRIYKRILLPIIGINAAHIVIR
ncbi:Uncharacterized protein FKW44_022030 [Caligus rogercresseyi]|uniref:Uncharacterized protein n=1 Tax=Caligus rogercresseyi TaxID=217165 RepID=A0A7T8JWL2_CALRO|nr:Uncharacterized protein FKW44_022030 [Caligus rogercresseyi]